MGSESLAFVRSTLDLSGEKLLASISIRFICKREIRPMSPRLKNFYA